MPPGGGASRTWLRAAFALDSKAGSSSALSAGLPPTFLCPSVWIAGAVSSVSAQSGQRRTQLTQAFTRQPWTSCGGTPKRCFTNASASAATPEEESAQAASTSPEETAREIPFVESEEYIEPEEIAEAEAETKTPKKNRSLPLQCPGCGAFSQTTEPELPGYFDVNRHSTMEYLGLRSPKKTYPDRVRNEDKIVQEAMRRLELEKGSDSSELQELGVFIRPEPEQDGTVDGKDAKQKPKPEKEPEIICVRCHDLVHHHAGKPIFHPGIDAIRETIAESPYKYNHVYHVLDAADFPMSLLPRIHELLDAMPLRSRNRRARHGKFYGGRKTELSFVITRADLLAPRKEQVDRLMPWIRETLRQALGRNARDVRLGNITCVSARRNWWTSELREEIFKNGGANWLVGKANVGKSYLVHHVFPKGRMDDEKNKRKNAAIVVKNAPGMLSMSKSASGSYGMDPFQDALGTAEDDHYDAKSDALRANTLADDGLLPPKPVETNYPQMPVVSNLPGTTASPIRIPFGGGKGELIDLPGLERTALVDCLQEEHQESLVMKTRVQPEQVVLTGTWHSLLIGGFIRITPRTPDLVFMTYNFTPLQEHRTGTDRAIEIQEQTSEINVQNISLPGTGEKIRLAGSFKLKYDVTKQRAGPITRKDAVNISVDRLPYRVLSIDLLIEGCGWIEIVAQVRTRNLYDEVARREYEAEKAKRALQERDAEVNKVSSNGVLQSLDLSDPAEQSDLGDHTADPFTAIFDAKFAPKKKAKVQPPPPVTDPNAIQPRFKPEPEPKEPEIKEPEPNWPVIDVFSPGGKFIGSRQPLGAWAMLQKQMTAQKKALKSRPRKSMKGSKKQERAAQAARRESRQE